MSPTLVGRQEELEFLEAFVRAAAVNGGTLLVSGGPGVGKTALLDAAEHIQIRDVETDVLAGQR